MAALSAGRNIVDEGRFPFGNSGGGDAIGAADIGKPCYVVDDQTLGLTDDGGIRFRAGLVCAVEGRRVDKYLDGKGRGAPEIPRTVAEPERSRDVESTGLDPEAAARIDAAFGRKPGEVDAFIKQQYRAAV